jgi:two-component system LytT family sensor kinase
LAGFITFILQAGRLGVSLYHNNQQNMKLSKIELWVTTIFFMIILLFKLYYGLSEYGYTIDRSHSKTDYIFNELIPRLFIIVIIYCAFVVLNFYAVPKLWFKRTYLLGIGLIVVVIITMGTLFMVAQSYISNWIYDQYGNGEISNMKFFSRGFTMATIFLLVYGAYVLIREGIIYQFKTYQTNKTLSGRIAKEIIMAFSIWFALLIPMMAVNTSAFFHGIGPFYLVVFPFCFGVYFINLYWLIPMYKKGAFPSVRMYLLALFIMGATLGFLEVSLLMQFSYGGLARVYIVFYWMPPFVLTAGLSWWVYTANAKTYQQFTKLKTALGTSNANLQFLRSQINPHFLFNALNTLYGTALMEKAERTGEGIQKLGDMMRFMLHENTQELIPLNREIEYLHNYIGLQNLRIAMSEQIEIKTNITDRYNSLNIAPMLLIPFIENAYKHGISFKEKSWINVSLQLHGDTLLLDVYNSIHPNHSADPEEKRSGIGLENVKLRLQLLYADKHELVIRENNNEFFIHLRVQLS